MFKKYQHIERLGNNEVEDIEIGITHVFPKIDGTNGSIWIDNGNIKAGSRNRELSIDNDNQGFYKWVLDNQNIKNYLTKHPDHRLYGEWLVPHSLRTYRYAAWRKFYVFDITIDRDDTIEYIPYDIYKELLEEFDVEYIPLLVMIKNGSYEKFINQLQKNVFLIEDGKGAGEGIVIKNYAFYNKYGRQTWAKIVTSEFKDKHRKEMGVPILETSYIEDKIVNEFLTKACVEKEYAKIAANGWESKMIPQLLGVVWHEFIIEETWNFIKKYKNPKIDYKLLQRFVTAKIKEHKKELF
jgi:hypothetical protein